MPAKFEWSLARSPKSDPQRARIYRMENEAIGARQFMQLPRADLCRYIRSLVRMYRAPKVVVRFGDLGEWAAEWRDPNIIVFGARRDSRDLLTAAHEFAHHLHNWLSAGLAQEPHGKEFMGCYMSVLDTTRFIPVLGMRAICDSYKIAYVDPGCRSSLKRLKQAVRAGQKDQ